MWRHWVLFDPRRALITRCIFRLTLALVMHFILQQMTPLPPLSY